MNDRLIGYKNGMAIYVSDELLAQKGDHAVRDHFGLIRRYPIKTNLSGNVVMVEGNSHEEALAKYLSATSRKGAV